MIVVDTNILVHALVESPRTDAVRRLRVKDPAWRIPGLWRWEFTNVLWLKATAGGMDRETASGVVATAAAHFEPLERPVSMVEAFASALEHAVTCYDGAFLALAKRQGLKLVTEDKKLRRAAPALACSLEDYLSQCE